ncbi:MAG: hypothetical protein RQ826_00410 [Xanthomonadales bacterium]|nr:hypothetical protein [Xanthomonadales bacterium]
MRTLAAIGVRLDALCAASGTATDAEELLALGEEVLEHWVSARGHQPTHREREGFRLLALHRQGADKEPSFNACRETCRELAWHYNLLTLQPDHEESASRARMMALVARHLYLFVSGKMESAQLGEFCCASRPVRERVDSDKKTGSEYHFPDSRTA